MISSSERSLGSLASALVHQALDSTNYWQRLHMTALPLLASVVWYYSRTVIRVTDDEQALWVKMWLSQQARALGRVRRLRLFPATSTSKGGRSRRAFAMMGGVDRKEEDEDKEEGEEGRFAPPKLDFQPDDGVVTWSFFGGWPVSVSSDTSGGAGVDMFDPYSGLKGAKRGYIVTIWFSPFGKSIAREMLMQGRKLWLAKRAKKTEIWMYHRNNGGFQIVTRPSRPLSSVIVDGDTKKNLRQDAIHFLNAEKWYISKGIPYRRGYLLHGPPGCGKTSLITALAGDLRMPITVVPLNDQYMDDSSLMHVLRDAPKNSLVLIEDIDCALPKETSQHARASMMNRYGMSPVTLSGLLNAIDGVAAQEGRLLFMTTNHIDRLDEALIRPGRVDAKFHLDKATKNAAGELFDQFFAPSAAHANTLSADVIQSSRKAFLEKVEDKVHSFASLQGIFMSAKDDPNKVAEAMDKLLASPSAWEDPTKKSAYDEVKEMEKSTKEAIDKERQTEQAQREAGKPVVKRLAGHPASNIQDTDSQQITMSGNSFRTFGAPEKLVCSGVLYYEIQVIQATGWAQFGFSLKDGLPICDDITDDGVGDNNTSWAVDGSRCLLWHGGNSIEWKGSWNAGCVLGFAANMDKGMIAVSKDGNWSENDGEAGYGVVFSNEAIKQGVFPAFSASLHTIRYSFEGDEGMKHGPPPGTVWDDSTGSNGKKNGEKQEAK